MVACEFCTYCLYHRMDNICLGELLWAYSSASNNRIRWLSKHDLPSSLTALDLRANPLSGIKPGAINYMPRLRKLYVFYVRLWRCCVKWVFLCPINSFPFLLLLPTISWMVNSTPWLWKKTPNCDACRVLSDARSLSELPSLDGCGALEILRVDRASLSKVPFNLCKTCPRLKSL